ncbi:MAG: molybdopterin-synthase adenylyltransferase MoeB [Trueperaceae bacterium]|nr:MAG: molybdopterin-synthase adenylyltransferase MoeB [Trueperaceae bacterium]
MFSKEELDRYSRHIILPGVGARGQRKLVDARVLVVGAGGLGSPVLTYLAAAGMGCLGIVDDDKVDLTNLQRQVLYHTDDVGKLKTTAATERIRALNPNVQVSAYPERLSRQNIRSIIRAFDLIIDGSDNFPTRYLVNDACILEGKPLLYGAISQFEGQVSLWNTSTHEGARGPCYRCLFPSPPPPGSVPSCAEAGVFGVLPGVVGSMMAVEALKVLLGLGTPLAGVLLHYDALESDIRRIRVQRNVDCVICGDEPQQHDLIDYRAFCGL